MSVKDIEAGTISFAHLSGLARISAAKSDAPEDDKKDAKKAEDDSDDADASAESDDDKKDAAKAEADEPEDDDDKKDDKAKKAESDDDKKDAKKATAAERARWAAVLSSKAFARNAAIGAHLLANTSMSAAAVMSVLRDAPAAASSNDAARSARNPNLGASAPAVAATTNDRWAAAIKRAGIVK